MKSLHFFILISLLFTSLLFGSEKKFRFAVIPKNTNSNFFEQVNLGCQKAASELDNVECLYIGEEEANPRYQLKIIEDLITLGIDGIAISVIHSNFLEKNKIFEKLKKANIPFITFDSDLSEDTIKKHPKGRLSYIGTDNFEFGKELGRALLRARPQGGLVCIQSGWESSSNLNERIMGIRSILNDEDIWKESKRCPLYCNDDDDRAMFQIKVMLPQIDAFVAVGGWAQYDKEYKEGIQPFINELIENKKTLIMGDTTQIQIKLISEGLSFYNVGQNPFKMGEESIKTLYKIKTNQEYKKIIYTPLTNCTYKNYKSCLK
jgi:ribose transport system substrate-binding protein